MSSFKGEIGPYTHHNHPFIHRKRVRSSPTYRRGGLACRWTRGGEDAKVYCCEGHVSVERYIHVRQMKNKFTETHKRTTNQNTQYKTYVRSTIYTDV